MARTTMKAGSWFLVLFSLPFAAVGVGMGGWAFSGAVAHWKMQRWEETPAKIVWARLESHSGSKGGSTYQATAEYTYRFGDRQYTGHRVGIAGGSDNFGSYQQDVHRQLSAHQASRPPVPLLRQSGKPGRGDSLPRSPLGDGRLPDTFCGGVRFSRFWPADLRRTQLFYDERQPRARLASSQRTVAVQAGLGRGEDQVFREDIHHRSAGGRPVLERGVRARLDSVSA